MERIWAGISPAHFFLLPLQAGRWYIDTSDNLANMKPCEYNNILTGLIAEIASLKERRPSAGRLKYLEGYAADVEELTRDLMTDILERVQREIWLEADEGIDYSAQSEQILSLLPIELPKANADEVAACQQLADALEKLGLGMRKVDLKALDKAYSIAFPNSTPINVNKKKRT